MQRPVALDRLLALALEEDLPAGDLTSEVSLPLDASGRGEFVARSAAVLAGTAAAGRVFELVDPTLRVRFERRDGDRLEPGTRFGRVAGSARSLLAAERTALNLLQRLSGVATLTRTFVDAIAGTGASITDTRKTTPGFRALEKAAVRAGGGRNHRSSLSDGILIKTNHVRVAGGVAEAVRRARAAAPHPLRIEIEVRDRVELAQALEAGAEICLLDNMSVAEIARSVELARGTCLLEASGGVRLDNVRAIAETGVDLISVGRLTHSAPAADLALEIDAAAE